MTTVAELAARSGVTPYEQVALDELVPVLSGLQVQGDVAFVPCGTARSDLGVPVTGSGVTLVQGIHPHHLVADGDTCRWQPGAGGALGVGVIHALAPCWIIHPEHGGLGLAPGAYEVRRQREQAEEQRLVAD